MLVFAVLQLKQRYLWLDKQTNECCNGRFSLFSWVLISMLLGIQSLPDLPEQY